MGLGWFFGFYVSSVGVGVFIGCVVCGCGVCLSVSLYMCLLYIYYYSILFFLCFFPCFIWLLCNKIIFLMLFYCFHCVLYSVKFMCLCVGVPIFLMKFTIFVLWASFRFWGVLVCFCVFGFFKVVWFSYKHLHFFYKVLHFSYKGLRFFDKVLRNYSFVFVRIVLLFTKHMVFWLLF